MRTLVQWMLLAACAYGFFGDVVAEVARGG
jgi:hypothetical protein